MPILSPALGATVPDSPHATVVCLPTLADVESYERKEERVWKLLRSGYPRFVRNELVTRAAQEAARRLGRTGELFPLISEGSARRLAEWAGAPTTSLDRVGDWCLVATPPGDAAVRLAKMVQHTGSLISSRQAEAWLAGHAPVDGTAALATIRVTLSPFLAGVNPADILVAASGMNAVDAGIAAVDSVQRARGRSAWVQLGWLYVDSTRLFEKARDAKHHFVSDVRDLAAVERLLASGTIAGVFTEVPNNPQLETADIPALRALCDKHGAKLLLDPSSVGLASVDVLPFADILVSSLTKYAGSEGDVMAGLLAVNPSRPDATELLDLSRRRLEPLPALDLGVLAAQIGRMAEVTQRLSVAAAEIARRLAAHPAVARVRTADQGPTADAYRHLVRPGAGAGALITLELRGDMRRVYDRLAVAKGPSFGLRFTLAAPFLWLAHFEEVTNEAGRAHIRAAGLDPDLLRISVGLEPLEEIWAAFDHALSK
ncbi:MAG: PLP-dependent transferase [Verrucomicrobiota bacterium]